MADTHVTSGMITLGSGGSTIGNVNINGSVSVLTSGQTINVGNFPTTSISGQTVNVGNFPTTSISGQNVQTSISGNFVQMSVLAGTQQPGFNGSLVIQSGAAGVIQLTGASGGTGLAGFQTQGVANAAMYFNLQPYSGATIPGNFWIAGTSNPPYQDANTGVWQGYKNPVGVAPVGVQPALRAITDQSGYFLAWIQ